MSQQTFISHAEEIVDDVAQWGIDRVNLIVEALAPDGRPFGMERRSQREELEEYMQLYRGNPEAWLGKVEDMVTRITTILTDAGVQQDDIAKVHPYSIAQAWALHYSARMEKLLRKSEEKAREETLRPLPTDEEVEVDDAAESAEDA